MDSFTIEIAGLVTRVQPLFSSTREYCRPYLTESEPDIYVAVTQDDLVYEQKMAEIEAMEEGLRIRKFTDPFLERATIQRKIARELLNRDTILLHGSTIGVDGAAYLFTAPCGTGKSTHTRLWREAFEGRSVMVNDDKAFLQITDSTVFAYGSPWSGKHGLGTNITLPLAGICFLRRGAVNRIQKANPGDYMGELRHQCFIPADAPGQKIAGALVDRLAQLVPLWEMECTKDPSAARLAHQTMSRGASGA